MAAAASAGMACLPARGAPGVPGEAGVGAPVAGLEPYTTSLLLMAHCLSEAQ